MSDINSVILELYETALERKLKEIKVSHEKEREKTEAEIIGIRNDISKAEIGLNKMVEDKDKNREKAECIEAIRTAWRRRLQDFKQKQHQLCKQQIQLQSNLKFICQTAKQKLEGHLNESQPFDGRNCSLPEIYQTTQESSPPDEKQTETSNEDESLKETIRALLEKLFLIRLKIKSAQSQIKSNMSPEVERLVQKNRMLDDAVTMISHRNNEKDEGESSKHLEELELYLVRVMNSFCDLA